MKVAQPVHDKHFPFQPEILEFSLFSYENKVRDFSIIME